MGPIEKQIHDKLSTTFQPDILRIENFSAQHAGHAGVGEDQTGETHFRIHIKASAFSHVTRVAAERSIHTALKDWMNAPIHALQVKFITS